MLKIKFVLKWMDEGGTGPECNFSHIAFLTALTLAACKETVRQ